MRPRFTLRFLLMVVTIAAVGLGIWRVGYVGRKVSEVDVEQVELGHRIWQIRLMLGAPHNVNVEHKLVVWEYEVVGTNYWVVLFFEEGRVVSIDRYIVIDGGTI